ncbi:hypothetical protein ACJX0J_030849, partial [Zea mays]
VRSTATILDMFNLENPQRNNLEAEGRGSCGIQELLQDGILIYLHQLTPNAIARANGLHKNFGQEEKGKAYEHGDESTANRTFPTSNDWGMPKKREEGKKYDLNHALKKQKTVPESLLISDVVVEKDAAAGVSDKGKKIEETSLESVPLQFIDKQSFENNEIVVKGFEDKIKRLEDSLKEKDDFFEHDNQG